MTSRLNITVMLGGPSAEREVSLRSGAAVARALKTLGHEVSELDPCEDSWRLPPGTDLVFLALHGTYGEDGAVQRQLEALGVPYTGCDSRVSALAFDKVLTKRRCLQTGVPTAPFEVITSVEEPWPAGWRPPVVLKPVREGSSVGLKFVDRIEDWTPALREVFAFGSEILMEERIVGREVTVGILGGEILPVVEVRPGQGGYDYRNKYTAGATEYLCPAPFSPEVTRAIQKAASGAFGAVGNGDYARVDIMVRDDREPVVLEVNTLPGMTETSLFPKAAAAAGLGFSALCQRMIHLASSRVVAASVS